MKICHLWMLVLIAIVAIFPPATETVRVLCRMKPSATKTDTANVLTSPNATTLLKPSGPNLRPTVYPPSRVEYCDDLEDDDAQDHLSTGAISGARSPFSSMFRGKRRKPRKPKPGSGQDKGKPPPPVEGGKGKGWGKADTMFDGVSAGTGVINLGRDLAGGDSEEGGEGKED
ncbi:hypothetical protein pipiens_003682 [Culex pipiens pipiens]|uniref:Uncharacterized protein n=1 Tax=Culex pipiens pipiens TaxID=38569 RepID=A0ABD1CU44_CULPP